MTDPHLIKLAQVLVKYSLDVQPGKEMAISTTPLAQELTLAVYKEAILAGAHVLVNLSLPGAEEVFYKYANDEQIEYIPPIIQTICERYAYDLFIGAPYNTRELTGVDSARISQMNRARTDIYQIHRGRAARKELKWCYTIFPTEALAQEADMSLAEYQDFVYSAEWLDLPDPVAAWKAEAEKQRRLTEWLAGHKNIVCKGTDIDLSMSIDGRTFLCSAGEENFPSGEIFTGPVENSANGWVHFTYPAIYNGREIVDVELWFEDGKVVKEKAKKGQDLLSETLNTDNGSRYLGELGIGTNYAIQKFTKNMLFDEKIGGTIHLAVGFGFPESGSKNDSAIHWDMLCNMADSEILVDGELFYKNGQFAI